MHAKREYERRFQATFQRNAANPGFQYSVLIVGVDGVSRLNAHRQLPKTVQYLKQEMGAIEMYGYTKVGDNTFPNLIPLLTGLRVEEVTNRIWSEMEPLDKLPFLWKLFARGGWSTLYAEDTPQISTFNYLKQGFLKQPTDYYFRPFILEYERALGRRKPLNCYECVGPQSETEVLVRWLKSYVELSLLRPFFAFAWVNSVTHDDFNGGSRVDDLYKSFFESLQRNAYLDNTIVMFLSDHGQRWGSIRGTYMGMMEDRLPMLFLRFPPTFRRHHPNIMRNLHINARRLTTPFDVHATLANLVSFMGTPRALDIDELPEHLQEVAHERAVTLFREIPLNRSCHDAGIDEQWCVCRPSIAEDPQNSNVQLAAVSLLQHVNKITSPHRNLCVELSISAVRSARAFVADPENINALDYALLVETSPGNALFEATIRLFQNQKEPVVLGDVARLNLYKGQADCVQNANLRKYCYCAALVITAF